jgi:hypothetical protein
MVGVESLFPDKDEVVYSLAVELIECSAKEGGESFRVTCGVEGKIWTYRETTSYARELKYELVNRRSAIRHCTALGIRCQRWQRTCRIHKIMQVKGHSTSVHGGQTAPRKI